MTQQYIKTTVRKSAAWMYYLSRMYRLRHRGKVLILAYHRVLSEKELHRRYVQPGMYVLNHAFEKQMLFLTRHFQIVSFADLLDLWKKEAWDTGKAYCVITFDDGWLDNYHYAYPILEKYRIPATIFLTTAFIGTKRWFWPEKMSYLLEHYYNSDTTLQKKASLCLLLNQYPLNWKPFPSSTRSINNKGLEAINDSIESCKQLAEEKINELIQRLGTALEVDFPDERIVLNWEEVSQMSRYGVSFGSHSCNHRILTKVPLKEAKQEIETSNRILIEKEINYVPIFCFPNGNYNRAIQNIVRDCGYEAAVASHFGFERESPRDLFGINRIGVHNDISSTIPLFSLHLSGPYKRGRCTAHL